MSMQAKLIVVGGKASKREVLLKLPSTIGRSREADLTVAHPMVSRKHCEAYELGGLLMIRDLGSLNGTYVGGKRVREAPLPPNREFTVGPLTFRVRYEYTGDLNQLPPVVLAGEANAAPPAPTEEAVAAATPEPVAEKPAEPSPAAEMMFEVDDEPDRVMETMFEVDDEFKEDKEESSEPGGTQDASSESNDPDFDAFLEDLK
jgi:hypothetical protein